MDADAILRVFGKATDSHRAMQTSARTPPAVSSNLPAPRDGALHREARQRPEVPSADAADSMVLPLPAPRQRFAHHGYQAARKELDDWRSLAAEAGEAEAGTEAAASVPMQEPPPQHDASASAVAVAERAARLAWQQAAQAAQLAAGQQAGHPAGSWPFPLGAQAGQEPPPQPPPPPSFALAEYGDAPAVQHPPDSSSCDVSAEPSAAAPEPHTLQEVDHAAAALPGDQDLSGLLSAWYHAGYETGRHFERRRLQSQLQQQSSMPQPVS